MPYDSNLDELITSNSWEDEGTRITVSVYSYNNGPKKLQIARENKDSNGNLRFTKLGRLAKEEIQAISPLIKEAIDNM